MSAWVYAYRGELVENRHALSLVLFGREGVLAYGGDPARVAYMRSSAKPFQALALFLTGAVERFGLSEEEVALATASHDGTEAHVAVAQGFLEKLGLGPEHLACGVHPPFSKEARKALEAKGLDPTPLHHNCSGKHAGMLAAALALGAPIEGYERPDHPVQRLNRKTLLDLTGAEPIAATDGCSVPTFALPLARAARAFYLLARPEEAPPPYREPLRRVGAAMRRHPELVAGPGSIDTLLMERLPLLAKRGADGYYGLALPETPHGPLGVALKVEDGASQAREVAVVALLRLLGLDPGETPWDRPVLRNHRGLEVGRLEAHLDLTWL
ncbi:asparaginase [Thermus oshimai]|uniref:asparaginase n=1 Tax=Thermus oshimai TaxID=56957 RepID=UPI0004770945|nr:asparaginase [Thermus oshimai]